MRAYPVFKVKMTAINNDYPSRPLSLSSNFGENCFLLLSKLSLSL
jgi:hypothetical protein